MSRAMQAFVAAGLVIGVAGYTSTEVLNANTRPVHAPEPTPSDEPGRFVPPWRATGHPLLLPPTPCRARSSWLHVIRP